MFSSWVKIFRLQPETNPHNLQAGTLVTDGKKILKVAVPKGFIRILELQSAGRKRMPTDAFLRGFTLGEGWTIE